MHHRDVILGKRMQKRRAVRPPRESPHSKTRPLPYFEIPETARLKAVLQTPDSTPQTAPTTLFRNSGNCPPKGGTPNSGLRIPKRAHCRVSKFRKLPA